MPTHRRDSTVAFIAFACSLTLLCAVAATTRDGQDGGRGGEHRADPCDHEPPGNAYGREQRCPPDGASGGVARGDFNGDGFGDLAIGVPSEDVGDFQQGAVHIIYGSAAGLSATAGPGDQFWTAAKIDDEGGQTVSPLHAFFGRALAAGRFNADPYSDLAIGVADSVGTTCGVRDLDPKADFDCAADAGVVQVLYGSAAGLTVAGSHVLRQGLDGLGDAAETTDDFGSVLNWGDFDGDGIGDLAVGVPDEDIGSVSNAGAVHVIYGSAAGLTSGRDRLWHQDSRDVDDVVEEVDKFGAALAAGDFNGDGSHDLAVGVPLEDVGSISNAGAVQILYGSPGEGLTGSGNQFWHQDKAGILDTAEADDRFGSALAAGNFTPGVHDSLAVGVPLEDVGSISDSGAVHVIYGSAAGLIEAGDGFWTQNSNGVQDFAEPGDRFGSAVAAGDFNGDSMKDLAVGVPFEDRGDIVDAGAVHVIYGSPEGIYARFGLAPPPQTVFARFLDQVAATGGLDPAEADDHFGSALTAWNFDRPGAADLAIGVPGEDVVATLPSGFTRNFLRAGAVDVLYGMNTAGSDTGLFASLQHWTQDSDGIEDQPEDSDRFGQALY